MKDILNAAADVLIAIITLILATDLAVLIILAIIDPDTLLNFNGALLDPGTWVGEEFSGAKIVDGLSKLTGIFTLASAVFGGLIAWLVSNHRRKEAEGVQFREYMKWSVERFSSQDENQGQYLEQVFAYMLIQRYAKEAPHLLEQSDQKLAEDILQLIDDVTSKKEVEVDDTSSLNVLDEKNSYRDNQG